MGNFTIDTSPLSVLIPQKDEEGHFPPPPPQEGIYGKKYAHYESAPFRLGEEVKTPCASTAETAISLSREVLMIYKRDFVTKTLPGGGAPKKTAFRKKPSRYPVDDVKAPEAATTDYCKIYQNTFQNKSSEYDLYNDPTTSIYDADLIIADGYKPQDLDPEWRE